MFILSQDRSELYNLNKVAKVVVDVEEICLSDSLKDEGGLIIGKYKTEKRAMEVLEDIYAHNGAYELFKNSDAKAQGVIVDDFREKNKVLDTFEMPKE